MRTYDIVNAGPNNRFMANGRIVSNSGRTFQPQNLPRPTLKNDVIEEGIAAMKAGVADLLFQNVMELCTSAVRGCLIAAPEKKLVIADLSNIEGRMLAFLAGEQWKLDAFAAFDAGVGHDLYKLAYARSFHKPPESITPDERQIGKVMELALGYNGGIGAFSSMADVYGIRMTEAQAQELVYAWRKAHPAIRSLWYLMEDAVRRAVVNPGKSFAAGKLAARVDGVWLRIRLPSGRYLCYPRVKVDPDGRISYEGITLGRKWARIETYGGKLCIARGTPILTHLGWKPIEQVMPSDRVWDGEDWVRHSGLARQGFKEVIKAHGVWMTPDHEILTTEGWRRASQSAGYNRAPCRLPDGYAVPPQQREALALGDAVRVWGPSGARSDRTSATIPPWDTGVLRVPAEGDNRGQEDVSRHVEASGVRGLALDERPVPLTDTRRVEELRRPRHSGLRALAQLVQRLLGRHGSDVRAGVDHRAGGQQRGLLPRELHLGDPADAREQSADEHANRNTLGRGDGGRSLAAVRAARDDAAASDLGWGDGPGVVRTPGYVAEVFDLIDCGPRTRFVVMGDDGQPLIVHNCENATQAASRDLFAHGMQEAENAGYAVVLHVHDELITETPDSPEYTAAGLAKCMSKGTQWSFGLPVAAAGFETHRYRKG